MPTSEEQAPALAVAVGPPAAAPGRDALARQRVIPLHHAGRWIGALIVSVLVLQVIDSVATNRFFQWGQFGYWFLRPVILDGLLVTLKVTVWTAGLSLLAGIVLALGRLSGNPVLSTISWAYIWLFRSIPLIVVLLFLYNFSALYPRLSIDIPFGPSLVSFKQATLAPAFVLAVVEHVAAHPDAAGSSRSTAASTRRPRRWACRRSTGSAASCCPRRCDRSSPTTSTSSSA